MRLAGYSCVAAAFLLTACQASGDPIEQERSVYQALLLHMGAGKATKLVVESESVSNEQLPKDFERLGIKDSDIEESFKLMNAQPSAVPWEGVDIKELVLVSDKEIAEIFRDGPSLQHLWESFYRRYPGAPGLIGASRVGFNSDATEAVVYIELRCGGLCGSGYIAHLHKSVWGWKVKRVEHLWVS
jgi:hypothetical protein